jgi:hypothetical protein
MTTEPSPIAGADIEIVYSCVRFDILCNLQTSNTMTLIPIGGPCSIPIGTIDHQVALPA